MTTRSPWAADRLQDWINLALAACLFVAPWVLGYAAETTAAWTAWVLAALVAAVAIAALVRFAEWQEWVNLLAGVATFIAPWVMAFAALGPALWAHVALGVAIALVAAWELWHVRQHRSATT
jgi:hypothetical protein